VVHVIWGITMIMFIITLDGGMHYHMICHHEGGTTMCAMHIPIPTINHPRVQAKSTHSTPPTPIPATLPEAITGPARFSASKMEKAWPGVVASYIISFQMLILSV